LGMAALSPRSGLNTTFEEIARVVGRSEAAARQLASHARRRVRGGPEVREDWENSGDRRGHGPGGFEGNGSRTFGLSRRSNPGRWREDGGENRKFTFDAVWSEPGAKLMGAGVGEVCTNFVPVGACTRTW